MPEFDRIDLMNFLRYGNDFDEQWDEIRNYIKSNPSVQKELEEIRKMLPQPAASSRRRTETYERSSFTSDTPPDLPPPRKMSEEPDRQPSGKKWWSKLLGDE